MLAALMCLRSQPLAARKELGDKMVGAIKAGHIGLGRQEFERQMSSLNF